MLESKTREFNAARENFISLAVNLVGYADFNMAYYPPSENYCRALKEKANKVEEALKQWRNQ